MPKTISATAKKTSKVSLPDANKAESNRILSFDLMRGYFLCVILLNHLGYYPNWLTPLTGQGFLYASTAEGFFAVSGIVLGIVRGRKLLNQPFSIAAKLLWKRAAQLYITSIVLTLLFTVIGQLFINNPGLKFGIYTDWSNWWNLIWQTITLTYSYSWADFLRFYALFLAAAPAFLWLLRKNLWYVGLAISFGLWALYPSDATGLNAQLWQPLAWQLLFFASFAIGFYWQNIISFWRKLPSALGKTIKTVWVVVFLATLFISFALVFNSEFSGETAKYLYEQHRIIEQNFLKDSLPLERIGLGIIWFWGIFIIFRRFEKQLMRYTGGPLYAFGSHSLYVYTVSAVVIFFMHLIVPPPGFESRIINFVLSVSALAIVWLALKTNFLTKVIPR